MLPSSGSCSPAHASLPASALPGPANILPVLDTCPSPPGLSCYCCWPSGQACRPQPAPLALRDPLYHMSNHMACPLPTCSHGRFLGICSLQSCLIPSHLAEPAPPRSQGVPPRGGSSPPACPPLHGWMCLQTHLPALSHPLEHKLRVGSDAVPVPDQTQPLGACTQEALRSRCPGPEPPPRAQRV